MSRSVLVVGVYLLDQPSYIEAIAAELGKSSRWALSQRWLALGSAPIPDSVASLTVRQVAPPGTKFSLLNELLKETETDKFGFVIVCDDDIVLPPGFVDRYLDLVERYNFALAQPARTHDSFIDHPFVEQLDGLVARQTRFVEIGPLFSIHRRIFPLIFPFDETSPMGWGYDFFWPCILAKEGFKMGIVDATPVAHSLRKPVSYYEHGASSRDMENFLASRPHLSPDDAFFISESYAL
jgi:hypothetical protein